MCCHIVQQLVHVILYIIMYKQLNVTDKGETLMVYEPPTLFPRVINKRKIPAEIPGCLHLQKGTKQGGYKVQLTGGPTGPGGPGAPVEP